MRSWRAQAMSVCTILTKSPRSLSPIAHPPVQHPPSLTRTGPASYGRQARASSHPLCYHPRMPAPGRNDPCPCGSGKKYKHCCLTHAQAATGITPADRDEVSAALMRYTRRPEWDDVVADAALMWMGDDPDVDPQDAIDDILALDTSRDTFFDWLFYDLPLEGGRTTADAFLDRHARSLNPRALDYLRLMQGTCLRAWQVRSVEPGVGMALRDLWSNDEVTVAERTATRQIVIWDVLVARVVRHADGTHQLEGSAMLLPASAAPTVVKGLKAEHRQLRRSLPDAPDELFFKIKAPFFHILWDELVAGAEPPDLQTTEGDALSLSELEFDVPRAGEALAALLHEADFEAGDVGEAVWMEEGPQGRRVLASVSCAKGTLTVRTLSRERAARARARLDDVLGPLPLRREEHREPDLTKPADLSSPLGGRDEGLSIDDIPELAAYRDRLDREWLDVDVPALDGKTPRQAAKDRRLRPRLKHLLIDIENREARMAAPNPPRDLTWMWKELGLKRP